MQNLKNKCLKNIWKNDSLIFKSTEIRAYEGYENRINPPGRNLRISFNDKLITALIRKYCLAF